jgi:hypothetical protein
MGRQFAESTPKYKDISDVTRRAILKDIASNWLAGNEKALTFNCEEKEDTKMPYEESPRIVRRLYKVIFVSKKDTTWEPKEVVVVADSEGAAVIKAAKREYVDVNIDEYHIFVTKGQEIPV